MLHRTCYNKLYAQYAYIYLINGIIIQLSIPTVPYIERFGVIDAIIIEYRTIFGCFKSSYN